MPNQCGYGHNYYQLNLAKPKASTFEQANTLNMPPNALYFKTSTVALVLDQILRGRSHRAKIFG